MVGTDWVVRDADGSSYLDDRTRASELERLRLLREGKKPTLVARLLKDSVSANHHIFPSFGRAIFFEMIVRNPFNHEERFAVQIDDSLRELRLVTDPAQYRVLRKV